MASQRGISHTVCICNMSHNSCAAAGANRRTLACTEVLSCCSVLVVHFELIEWASPCFCFTLYSPLPHRLIVAIAAVLFVNAPGCSITVMLAALHSQAHVLPQMIRIKGEKPYWCMGMVVPTVSTQLLIGRYASIADGQIVDLELLRSLVLD